MKRILTIVLLLSVVFCVMPMDAEAVERKETIHVAAKSAILMEATTGAVLFSQNETEALAPASVTKVMTLLLVMEAIEAKKIALTDVVRISANAASMGGSQVFMKEGEEFTVEELLKCCVIASANDAAVALAEHTYGTEALFVAKMNERSQELNLQSTKFENTTGLDDTTTAHLTSAVDIAIMSRELIRFPKILEYSSLWQDSIRDGAFTLTNTNRLVRYYKGCTGLKTGSTDKAGYCISVTAERDGLSLICVVMGAQTRDERNSIATGLLDHGFAEYSIYKKEAEELSPIPVLGGVKASVHVKSEPFASVVAKGGNTVSIVLDLPETLQAPVSNGDIVGRVYYELNGERIGESDIIACEDVGKITYLQVFWRMVLNFIMGVHESI